MRRARSPASRPPATKVEVCLPLRKEHHYAEGTRMRRLLVYSHDTFGSGDIRRTPAICEHLVEADVDLSIFLVTGSP